MIGWAKGRFCGSSRGCLRHSFPSWHSYINPVDWRMECNVFFLYPSQKGCSRYVNNAKNTRKRFSHKTHQTFHKLIFTGSYAVCVDEWNFLYSGREWIWIYHYDEHQTLLHSFHWSLVSNNRRIPQCFSSTSIIIIIVKLHEEKTLIKLSFGLMSRFSSVCPLCLRVLPSHYFRSRFPVIISRWNNTSCWRNISINFQKRKTVVGFLLNLQTF